MGRFLLEKCNVSISYTRNLTFFGEYDGFYAFLSVQTRGKVIQIHLKGVEKICFFSSNSISDNFVPTI